MGEGATRLRLELGCSHREFHRSLPPALSGWSYTRTGESVHATRGDARVRIVLAPERERRIALLALPVTEIALHFAGLDAVGVERFMADFRRAFQRGGG